MPTFVSIIIFSYFAALIILVIAGLFLIFKYDAMLGIKSEYNVNLLVEEEESV
tara:strand:- start:810 stop:968 length:159 start_codon:yes stop_codon:yes gene_type:complete